MVFKKQIADTDSQYCKSTTSSNQSGMFLGPSNQKLFEQLFGRDYSSSTKPSLAIYKSNLALNVLAHFFDQTPWYDRSTQEVLELDKQWLEDRIAALEDFFEAEENVTVSGAALNREITGGKRLYIKGLHKLKNGEKILDLREYFFSGDVLEFLTLENGVVGLRVELPDGPLSNIVRNGLAQSKITTEIPSKDIDADLGCRLIIALNQFQKCRGECAGGDEDNLEEDFKKWCVEKDGKAKTTAHTYAIPLRNVTRPMINEGMSSTWTGIYEFIFGKKAAKGVFEIDSVEELNSVYGELLKVYAAEDLPMPEGVIPQNWNKVRAWVKADRAKGSKGQIIDLPAFHKYEAFLADRAELMAKGNGPSGWVSYDAWAVAARKMFADVDAAKLTADGFDYMKDFAQKFVYNVTVANTCFKNHGEEEKTAVGNFLAQERQTPHAVSWYLEEGNRPVANDQPVSGMGAGVMLNFMMKVRPAEFATYSPMLHRMYVATGLTKEAYDAKLTVQAYESSKALQGQVLAKMHELHIGQTADDPTPADYLTVNEFAWWLSDEKNLNLIKEKVMSKKLRKINSAERVKQGDRTLADAFKDDMMKRLAAALRTKPFAILAGHSGTGKSQLVRRLAYMTCNNEDLIKEGEGKTAPGNYCMVQVKPNWHDSTDLLGYYTDLGGRHFVNTPFVQFLCKAYAYPETPFFLCLDEMNLAPVEQYFAEYLSAVESLEKKGRDWLSDSLVEVATTNEKDENGNSKPDPEIIGQIMQGEQSQNAFDWIKAHGLTIPKNLFVVGTVNMDETTCQFSRKVLDRAMTLLMNKVEFGTMKESVQPKDEKLLDPSGIGFFLDGARTGTVGQDEATALGKVNEALSNTAFVIAYRFANEYALYEDALKKLDDAATLQTALDDVVLMKLLPRIHGMKDVVEGIFNGRKAKKPGEVDIPGLKEAVPAGGKSANMMDQILKRSDDYLTFWP